jgi:hypothetical protein
MVAEVRLVLRQLIETILANPPRLNKTYRSDLISKGYWGFRFQQELQRTRILFADSVGKYMAACRG